MDPLTPPRRTRRYTKNDIQYLNENELEALFRSIRAAGSPRDLAIFEVAYHRGLRAGEVRLLQIADFNPAARTLFVRRLKGSNSGEYIITDREHDTLTAYLTHRGPHPGAIFGSRRGLPISRQTLHDLINAYGAACGLIESKRHFHVLRHSCAVALLDQGIDIALIQDHLGHKDIKSTMVYAKVRNKRRQEVGRRLAKEW